MVNPSGGATFENILVYSISCKVDAPDDTLCSLYLHRQITSFPYTRFSSQHVIRVIRPRVESLHFDGL